MTTPRTLPSTVRRVLPWLLRWWAVQAALAVVGRLVARRKNEGDESTAGIRRVVVVGGDELRPVHPELSRVRLDVLMGGVQLDLGAVPHVPGGVDLTVRALMGGVGLTVPAGWKVWWDCKGVGGVGFAQDDGLVHTDDERGADLRVHATVLLGGIGIEGAPQDDSWGR
ncbi:hypothetical protein SAMN05660209_03135 [Geodermatophilus africanus]|jgi:hypothetical protein|uniref:Cell wall-active antibiotics response 4TMS YvqF n=1 Tax=Geodermatophilus africanus TaxID=1137993 RepID=A0A1H3KTJ3_9ACTN|nr:hypothetical protein [Geodermatophilus africanus]SDY55527.1 hypothetical protein SAMN05660209_03135 [Geodermatophilus africanus]